MLQFSPAVIALPQLLPHVKFGCGYLWVVHSTDEGRGKYVHGNLVITCYFDVCRSAVKMWDVVFQVL